MWKTVSAKSCNPAFDPDCKVGVKRSTNQEQPDGSKKVIKEYLWGYGSGIVSAITADYGDVVLAEYTQPFNEGDITYYRTLYQKTVNTLNHFPQISPQMQPLMPGTCMKHALFMEELPLFPSTNTVIPLLNVMPMELPSVRRNCRWSQQRNLSISTAIAPNTTNVLCYFLKPLDKPVITSNLRKAKAVLRTATSKKEVFCASPWIAPIPFIKRSTPSGPQLNASIVKPKHEAENDLMSGACVRYAIHY